jgi:isoleucyl-tRNA synthetase
MSELGPAFGDDAGRVMNALNEARIEEWDLDRLDQAVKEQTGLEVELQNSMVEPVQEVPDGISHVDFVVDSDTEDYDGAVGRVYVDTNLTEVIRRVHEMRKDLELDIQAQIRLDLEIRDERVAELVRGHEELIAEEVRAEEIGTVEDRHRKAWDVEGVEMEIAIEKVAEATV